MSCIVGSGFCHQEFQGNLIRPEKWSLFRGNTLTEEEQSRFREIVPLANDPRGLQKYAETLMKDEGIFEKVASYKQSTVKAFALGTCDAPLCDEVCFLFENLNLNRCQQVSHDLRTVLKLAAVTY